MTKKWMLIEQNARETRTAIVRDTLLEEFDCEIASNRLQKGNIYVGKVMRIEKSLQAAFLDYGFERHGFLALSEIHPCYHQTSEILPTPEEDTPTEEEVKTRKPSVKIQDALQKDQMVLVQVIKDGRSSKGAALTSYISLPGRCSIFLPNTPQNHGISRKITGEAREQLKEVVSSLDIPPESSLIIRSASQEYTKREIKRDYDYLVRLWTDIEKHSREHIGLVYEEHDLLVRSLRDVYTSDMDEVIVQGAAGFKKARAFMKIFMPSHVKKIQLYQEDKEGVSLFEKYQVEESIEAIYQQKVRLPSGGELVINPTEALISIDVNSARATQERHIEDTALKTNLEAADAIAHQLRLRNLSGLIVIDFIDLASHKRSLVEERLKKALKEDRARLKVGKISAFGLLEMSRQRLRKSLLESHSLSCPHCSGSGLIPDPVFRAHKNLRIIENALRLIKEKEIKTTNVEIYGASSLIQVLQNQYRQAIYLLEQKYGMTLYLMIEPGLQESDLRICALGQDIVALGKKEKNTKKATMRTPIEQPKDIAVDPSENALSAPEIQEEKPSSRASSKKRSTRKPAEVLNKPATEISTDADSSISKPRKRRMVKKHLTTIASDPTQKGSIESESPLIEDDKEQDIQPRTLTRKRSRKRGSQHVDHEITPSSTSQEAPSSALPIKPPKGYHPVRVGNMLISTPRKKSRS